MTVLSRLGPALSSSRPQLLSISSSSFRSHTINEPLTFSLNPLASGLSRRIPGQRRNFSLANGLETAVIETAQFMTTFHNATGTPWYITIPLAALLVNTVVRIPVTIYSRKLEQKRTRLKPLFWAWTSRRIQQTIIRASPGSPVAQLQHTASVKAAKEERRISRDHGVQQWKIYYLGPITALPFFVTAIQCVRRLCGAPGGIFSLFTNPLPLFAGWISGKEAAGEVSPTAGNVSPSVTASATPGQLAFQPPGTPDFSDIHSEAVATPAASQTPLSTDLLGYDPSLSTGGCLWFPDLTVADPSHVLPYMLSAVMVWAVLPRTLAHTKQLLDPTAANLTWRVRFHRALFVVALIIGPLTVHLPAAMHLYWISSMVITNSQRTVVNKLMPLPRNDYDDVRPMGRDLHIVQPPPPQPPQPPQQ